ncbi:ParB/RepB/Spo0J family partition protein [Methylomagnum sp.]
MPAFEPLGQPEPLEKAQLTPEESDGSADYSGMVKNIPIEKIKRSPYQNRIARSTVEIADLAENVKADGLNNPIVVRPLTDGYFELISGETRLDAFLHLERQEIPAIIRELDDVQAARSTVLDNIFHNPLCDYEIYKGLKILLDSGAVPSIRALSKDTPYSKSHVHRLMAFGKLPEDAIKLLESDPGIIGANVAEALAEQTAKGYHELVLKALERIREGRLNQMRAVVWMASQITERSEPSKRVASHSDGKPYATLTRTGGTIKITTARNVDIDLLEEAVYALLSNNPSAFLASK